MQHPLGNPHAYTAEEAYELVSKPMYWWEVPPANRIQRTAVHGCKEEQNSNLSVDKSIETDGQTL